MTTLIEVLRVEGRTVTMVVEGPMNTLPGRPISRLEARLRKTAAWINMDVGDVIRDTPPRLTFQDNATYLPQPDTNQIIKFRFK